MTDAEFATYLSAWEVARDARDQDPTSASIARAAEVRAAYQTVLDIQRGDDRFFGDEGPATRVDWAPGVPQEAREASTLPDVATFYRLSAPAPEPRDGSFGDLLKRLGLLDWSGPGPHIRVKIAPPVVAPPYRGDFGDDVEDPEGPNPDDMVPGPDVPRWFYT